ncbi:GGDEF domain-containing protein [Butyrivibrio sp. CB08]|uniref:GGDEF domain-containing protein n=1 Tax=Butyrivibrio sp. CB08 TaxID=2364879 RepID=UPI000EAA663D|nr:GGDEF domain-containing protein [Butyrivibrio sp. CB08]RKM62305.1 GGDEF domain-containing protein [Butyrivibrio sp. CB08]
MTYVFYYVQAHIACILLLSIVFYKIVRGVNKQASQIYLGNLVITLMLYYMAEIFWAVVDGGIITATPSMLYLSNIFTYILISVAAYYWYIISEALQRDKLIENTVIRRLLAAPVLVSALLVITAYRTGLVFYVDETGKLVNGNFYVILVIVPFAYLIAASIKAFSRFANKDRYVDRNIYFMIGVFPFAPIILGALQAVYWRIPFLCYGTVAAVYYVYLTTLDNLISIDPLTQTNNRNQLYKYLVQKMRSEEQGMSLFLIMVDIDRLRDINESYGHAEGDRALNRVARAIKDACQGSRSRMFVSRYGADEFVVVAEMAYRAEAAWLADQIKNEVKRATNVDAAPCDIHVSVGIAQYDYQSPISIQAFIARADSDLYQNKKLSAI